MASKKQKQEEFIFLYSKKVKITKLVQSFTVIPSDEIVKYLKNKEIYLVDAMSVTEAEARVVQDFTEAGVNVDYKVSGARESRIIRVIE
mgnify:CR=1 FL=1